MDKMDKNTLEIGQIVCIPTLNKIPMLITDKFISGGEIYRINLLYWSENQSKFNELTVDPYIIETFEIIDKASIQSVL